MPNMNSLKKQRGFSILEVIFAMVVLSIALLSMARMHVLVTQDGGYSKARGIAVNLGQEKLDDLRSFTTLNASCATAGIFCFTDIGANTGGRENTSGNLMFPSGDVTVGNTTYNRTWAVTNYYRCGTNVPSTTNCGAPYTKSYPDFKVVVVTVAWTDEQDTARSVVLDATIYAAALTAEGSVLGAPYGGAGPKVSYRPIGVPDAVPVPVNVGGNQQKESSKPLPDVSQSGESKLVKFDAITYDTNDSLGDGTYTMLRKEEFFTVNCVCKYVNGTSSQPTATRLVWNGTDLVPELGQSTSKAYGVTHRSGPNADPDQPAECDRCCAEHHDSSSSDDAKYDPDRATSDYYTSGNAQGDHKHYWWTTVGNPAAGLTAVNGDANDVYLEACRFGRVNGLLYLWQDWRMVDLTVFGYDYLTSNSNANLATYQTYLVDKVKYQVKTDGSISGASNPAKPSGRDITFSQVGAHNQLLSRAIYLDKIYQKNSPAQLDQGYYDALSSKITNGQDWLLYVPFYEVNLTLLDDWSSSNSSNVSVTMQQVGNIVDPTLYYSSYNRGTATGLTAGTSATISARALISNSGLLSGVYKNTGVNCPATAANCISYGVDPQDNTTALSDSITVTVSGSSTTYAITGSINVGPGSSSGGTIGNTNSYSFTASAGAACSITSVTGGAANYSCLVASGWSGSIAPTRSTYELDIPPNDGAHSSSKSYANVTTAISGQNYQVCKSSCTSP